MSDKIQPRDVALIAAVLASTGRKRATSHLREAILLVDQAQRALQAAENEAFEVTPFGSIANATTKTKLSRATLYRIQRRLGRKIADMSVKDLVNLSEKEHP